MSAPDPGRQTKTSSAFFPASSRSVSESSAGAATGAGAGGASSSSEDVSRMHFFRFLGGGGAA